MSKTPPRLLSLPHGMKVRGHVEASADVSIEGELQGSLEAAGTLAVARTAVCEASLRAQRCEVHGEVVGDIVCTKSILVAAEARVVGNLRAPDIAIDGDAEFEGQLDYLPPDVAPLEREVVRPRRAGPSLRRPKLPIPNLPYASSQESEA